MNDSIALCVVMMPRDSNVYGTIFGGIILSYIDQAGFIEARKHGNHRWVTASIDKVDFERPVCIGDVVRFYTKTIKTGTSSVSIEIIVESERLATAEKLQVTKARLTMVSVDENGKSIPFTSPQTAHKKASA
ncbi:MAG: acyl-CoA thioesterase [Phycisphaerae bacterium]|jgi:acyl-CoA thioesterase YciA|nr:acyl-CoA thioesterase [Phycisphaerae bacterium]MBT5409279.1 acyl-CoA thioesterase [Phycisphaerae bacterium]MBT6164723.1 acyl-CoA thioesterase [Phycisphaerae bacterium]MBT7657775.1 acyl-CoA thioesterase [Phycisphaerae bacterium]